MVVSLHVSLLRSETTSLRIVVVGSRTLSAGVRMAYSEQENKWELRAVVLELEPILTSGKFTYIRRRT